MADERDPRVSERYRALRGEEPPRELDQAILAAAHRAADKAHAPLVAPAGRHRWYFAFGAAAILVLAVAITVQVERQPDPEAIVTAPAPAERKEGFLDQQPRDAERTQPEKQVERPKAKPGSGRAPAPAQEARKELAQDAAPAASPPAEPAVKPQASAELARTDRLEARTEPSVPQAAPAPQVRALEGRVAASAVPLSPERLLERIAELRKEGRHEEADKALAEFRQRYPDHRISEEMLQKVERKK